MYGTANVCEVATLQSMSSLATEVMHVLTTIQKMTRLVTH